MDFVIIIFIYLSNWFTIIQIAVKVPKNKLEFINNPEFVFNSLMNYQSQLVLCENL